VARINAIPPSPAMNSLRFIRSFSYARVAGNVGEHIILTA